MIKCNGIVLTLKSPARVRFENNWNNDMATYYPYVVATYMHGDKPEHERYDIGEVDPYSAKQTLEYDIDNSQAYDLEKYEERVEQGIEQKIARVGKTVKVFKGRTLPVGTVGTIFWVGKGFKGEERLGIDTQFGREFISRSNVEIVEAKDGSGI